MLIGSDRIYLREEVLILVIECERMTPKKGPQDFYGLILIPLLIQMYVYHSKLAKIHSTETVCVKPTCLCFSVISVVCV